MTVFWNKQICFLFNLFLFSGTIGVGNGIDRKNEHDAYEMDYTIYSIKLQVLAIDRPSSACKAAR